MAKPSARNRTIVRTWTVLHLIGERSRTIAELAADLSVTKRTVRRDLDALEEAGFPLYTDRHADGRVRWHLMPGNTAPGRRAA